MPQVCLIPKSISSTALSNCFDFNNLVSSGLKLTERVVIEYLRSSMNPPGDPIQFACKTNSSSFVQRICMPRVASVESTLNLLRLLIFIRFDPTASFTSKAETINCPRPLWAWVSDYFNNGIRCLRLSDKTSKPSAQACFRILFFCSIPSPPTTGYPVICSIMLLTSPTIKPFLVLTRKAFLTSVWKGFGNVALNDNIYLHFANVYFAVFRYPRHRDRQWIRNSCQCCFLKYPEVIVGKIMKLTSHISTCVKNPRGLSFKIRKLHQYKMKQKPSTILYTSAFFQSSFNFLLLFCRLF